LGRALALPMQHVMSDIIVDPIVAGADRPPDENSGGPVDSLAELAGVAIEPTLQVALRAVREMLGMDVCFVSEIVDGRLAVHELEGDGASFGLDKGLSMPSEQTYCHRMLSGRLPNLMPDIRGDQRTASLPITERRDVGAFATVPLRFVDGRLYGTLCAASHDSVPLQYRELQFLNVFARLIADQLERMETSDAVTRLAALVDAADDAIMSLTVTGLVTSWNPASERIFGYPVDEAIGRSIVDLITPPAGEDGMRLALSRVAAGEVVHRVAARRRADGAVIYDSVTFSPIRDEAGEVSLISAVSRDVTRSILEEHYRRVEQDVVNSLAGAVDAAQAARAALQGIGEGLDCEIGVLWEFGDAARRLRCSSLWINPRWTDARFGQSLREESFVPGEELPGQIWASGEPVWIDGLGGLADSRRAAAAAAAGLSMLVGLPVRTAGKIVGVVEFFSCNKTPRDPVIMAMGEALVGRLADTLGRHQAQEALRSANDALEIRVRARTSDLRQAIAELDAAQVETVHRLSRAVEFRDEDTGAHISRISSLAARTARSAGLAPERCELIERSSPLHDVGKVAIPDKVLLKPGPLTPTERSVMETHSEIGHRLLRDSDSAVLQLAATIALTHHERYDGSGYPHGLTGEDIPVEGRIVAIADVFDALTSDRVYRPAMTVDQALRILRDGRGAHFDPALLDVFLADVQTERRAARRG
jgi:PAS domain S-box-containing protein